MTVDDALAEVHRHFCAKDGTHDDACITLRGREQPSWTIVDSHMCTRCGFLNRSRDGIMAHLATCGA